ncbi:GH25 family lysozyme [Candidatus Allofournierella merdipullorum]|uniref:GH25 family lysozyme n=1 Tax=Candidatus Allofournierella merdipullorum TaxID=2838595 RepID=UPI002A8560A1|nr:GH25 family lysozyme [Candidatus Fournierella merdipullorum]
MKKALDISKHQSSFNAATAKAQGISTTICRCAYASSKDICWDTFAPAVQAAGMQLGAYGFLTAHYTSKASNFAQAQSVMRQQVQTWIDLCKAKGCTVLAVDQELEKNNTMLLVSKTYNTMLLKEAVAMIRAAGLTPMIYTGASWCLSYIKWQEIDCDFWVAYYPNSSATSDFTAYADGTFPGGQYGDLLRAMQAADKLWGWQYGSTGNLGPKYGAGSVNIDRNWQYKESEDEPMEFVPITGKQLTVFKDKNPATQAFGSANVNDQNYINLELGSYDITAMGDSITIGGMTAPWVKILVENVEWFCVALTDRCRIEDKPQAPAVDLTEVLAALARIEAKQDATDTKVQTVVDKLAAAGAALK